MKKQKRGGGKTSTLETNYSRRKYTMEASSLWSVVSAISAASAALISLIAILVTLFAHHKRIDVENKKDMSGLYSSLIEVDLALDLALRLPTKAALDRVKESVTTLLRSLVLTGIEEKHASLPHYAEECLGFLDELNFTEFKSDVITTQLSSYELKFRLVKNSLADKLGVKYDQ